MVDNLKPSGEVVANTQKGKIPSLRQQAEVKNRWLKQRLDKFLPELMARESFDMWIIITKEYNEDPVTMTLLPEPMMTARRTMILVFTLKVDGTVERLALTRYGIDDLYSAAWVPEKEELFQCLARIVKERDPKAIGINVSEDFAFGDGLTHSQYGRLAEVLGPNFMSRTKGAERLAVGWLEYRIQPEIDAYEGVVEIAHAIIAEAFSNNVIHPGVTTTDDVVWWMRDKMQTIGVGVWFQPSVTIQAPGQPAPPSGQKPQDVRKLILPGDLLHCDMGIVHLGLCTDTQQNAYVLKLGEDDAPEGLKKALAASNRLQEIHVGEFVAGRTGNEILAAGLAKAKSEEIKATLYTHPLGYHGHAAGPTIGLWDMQGGVPGRGDYPLFDNTCFSIELNAKSDVPEWGGQEVRIALEQDIVFTGGKVYWLGGRQTKLHLI